MLAIAGCSSSSATTLSVTHPTMVEISPDSFLGDVPCDPDGGLQRYVATLFDTNYVALGGSGGSGGSPTASVADDASAGSGGDRPDIPSSPPTQCRASVGFGYVVGGHRYRFEVDGYDTEDVRPRALGSPDMVDASGANLTPKWHAVCDGPIVAIDSFIVRSGRCSKPFEITDPSANGSFTIQLAALLGGLRCGAEPGEVDHFEVSLLSEAAEAPLTIPCGADAQARFEELAPGQRLSAYVAAFSADSADAFAGAGCSARTVPGANVDAMCDALNQTGTLRVDLAAALSQLDQKCTGGDLRLEISAPGDTSPQVVTPPACLQPFDHGFAPGPAALTVTARQASTGAELGTLTCHGDVTPGQLVSAECEPNSAE